MIGGTLKAALLIEQSAIARQRRQIELMARTYRGASRSRMIVRSLPNRHNTPSRAP
jgi:hypothetical protein